LRFVTQPRVSIPGPFAGTSGGSRSIAP
jgi:hypothetical protein